MTHMTSYESIRAPMPLYIGITPMLVRPIRYGIRTTGEEEEGHMIRGSHGGGREPKMKHVMSKQFILRYEEIISVRLEV